ncbi:MAG TPA: DUF4192 domain-containing protein [Micromonosporaceae bacterium]|jgi:hypothetical protein
MNSIPRVALRSPADMIAAIPYLFGFHPSDSLVLLGLRAKQIKFQLRVDLPPAGDAVACARQLATIVARQHVTRALLTGYGAEPAVTPLVRAVRTELMRRRIDVPEALRATAGRYFSYTCQDPRCCDPTGTPYDPSTTVVAAVATVAGINVMASREQVTARVAPVRGIPAMLMREAALRADMRLCDALANSGDRADCEIVIGAGIEAVDNAIRQWKRDVHSAMTTSPGSACCWSTSRCAITRGSGSAKTCPYTSTSGAMSSGGSNRSWWRRRPPCSRSRHGAAVAVRSLRSRWSVPSRPTRPIGWPFT